MHIIYILAIVIYKICYAILRALMTYDGAVSQCGPPRGTFGIPKRKKVNNFSPFAIPHVHASAPIGTPLVILYEVTPMQACTCYSNSLKKMVITPMGPLILYNNTRDQLVQLA